MKLAITGGTGFVGSFITAAALREGHEVTLLGCKRPAGFSGHSQAWTLGDAPDLTGADALVHGAFAHLPGRFRGGEGDDPAGFIAANRDGSLRLFDCARTAGVRVVLQLSSRAVFDGYPAGTLLTEDLPPRPDSLYGEMKAELEAALSAASSDVFQGISLRATGVYGVPPFGGYPHKWTTLLTDLTAGRPIPPRVSTEVHGDDLAAAALLLLGVPGARPPAEAALARMSTIAHASDVLLDHRDLAAAVARQLRRSDIPLPSRSDASRVSVLDCANLHRLGWRPGGWPVLTRTLAEMLPARGAGADR